MINDFNYIFIFSFLNVNTIVAQLWKNLSVKFISKKQRLQLKASGAFRMQGSTEGLAPSDKLLLELKENN